MRAAPRRSPAIRTPIPLTAYPARTASALGLRPFAVRIGERLEKRATTRSPRVPPPARASSGRPYGSRESARSAPRMSVMRPPAPNAARVTRVPRMRYTIPFAANPARASGSSHPVVVTPGQKQCARQYEGRAAECCRRAAWMLSPGSRLQAPSGFRRPVTGPGKLNRCGVLAACHARRDGHTLGVFLRCERQLTPWPPRCSAHAPSSPESLHSSRQSRRSSEQPHPRLRPSSSPKWTPSSTRSRASS